MVNETDQVLQGTEPLTLEGDLAAQMVEALDGYVSRAIADAVGGRAGLWNRDYSSHDAYTRSVEPNRTRLRKRIGCLDPRLPIEELTYTATTKTAAWVSPNDDWEHSITAAHLTESDNYTIFRVRWHVFDEVEGEGLLFEPKYPIPITAQIVALPDAGWTPEIMTGITDKVPANATVRNTFSRGRMSGRCSHCSLTGTIPIQETRLSTP